MNGLLLTNSSVLESIARSLDISPSDYERARSAIRGVTSCIEDGHPDAYPGSPSKPATYLQGSMRLGTVVRPIRDGREGDFDVDLVAELSAVKRATEAETIKQQIGDRLKADSAYGPMLEPEGTRCWTISYAGGEQAGFHMDVLPCVREAEDLIAAMALNLQNQGQQANWALSAVAITHREKETEDIATYDWRASNPHGYAGWFFKRNHSAFVHFKAIERQRLLQEATAAGLGWNDTQIPDELVRTPLQRAIQILKRHRDIRFATKEQRRIKPISTIITTLAAQIYSGESDTELALRTILREIAAYRRLLDNPLASIPGLQSERLVIRRNVRIGEIMHDWYIPNPVNPLENFADRWSEDNHARAKAFFSWADMLEGDILRVLDHGGSPSRVQELLLERMVQRKQFPMDLGQPERRTPAAPTVIASTSAAKPWGV